MLYWRELYWNYGIIWNYIWNYIEEKNGHAVFYIGLILKQVYIVPVAVDKITPGDLVESDMSSVQFSSVAQSWPTLCNPMNRSTPGLPIYHQLLESTQTHIHWIGDAIQPSHPLSSPFSSCPQSFPASGSFQMSQLFTSGGQSIGVSASTSVFPMNIQDWFPLDGLVGSPCSPRDSQESSPTPQLKSINSSALSFL